MRAYPWFARFGLTWLVALPVSLFIGLMIASAGTALYPPVTAIANPLICRGTVDYQSQGYSYRPGQSGVQRFIYCVTGDGKAAREDVTLKAIGISFLIYSAIAFVLLRLILVPLLRRRLDAALAGVRMRVGSGYGAHQTATELPVAPADVREILARVSEALERGGGNVVVRNIAFGTPDPAGDDAEPAERLTQLKRLYEGGLITAADYEAKKAEILSGL